MAVDTKEEDRIQAGHEEGAGAYKTSGDLLDAEQRAADRERFDEMRSPDNYSKDGKSGNLSSGPSSDTINNLEKSSFSYTPGLKASPLKNVSRVMKGKGPIAGVGALIGLAIAAITLPGAAPLLFLAGVPANLINTNDSVSPSMRRAFGAWMQKASQADPLCDSKKMKCKMGRISNSGLRRLAKNGVQTHFVDGTVYDGSRSGYPKKKISHYVIDGDRVEINELKKMLGSKGNFTKAAKIVGIRGAINLKVSAFRGTHFDSKIRTNWNIRYKGGIATGRKVKATLAEKRAAVVQTMRNSMPTSQTASAIKARASAKAEKSIGKYKKGGITYLVAAGSCAALKAPMYIVGAVAALQLARLAPLVVDHLYSPSDKMRADGVNYGPGVTEHDIDVVGTAFTETGPNSEGKMTSALESKYLLAAMGLSMGKLAVSEFAPGYTALKHPATQLSMKINNNPGVSKSCNFITNPITMWTAAAVDITITALLSATIIGGIIKVAAQWAASAAIMEAIMFVVSGYGDDIIESLADEQSILAARYEKFGDAAGTSAAVFGSASSMARLVPTLSESQELAWNKVMDEQREIDRMTDIASLSPFDISSKHTFLGSIVHHMQVASLQRGHMGIHIPSVLASAISPARLFATAQAGAGGYNTDLCNPDYGYAEEFNMKTDDPKTTPLINFAGMPCTGYVADMDIVEAVEILEQEGWVNPDVTSDRNDLLLDELMPNDSEDGYTRGIGYIKKDTPLYEFIHSCGNPDSGDHLTNTPGCILPQTAVDGSSKLSESNDWQLCNEPDSEGGECRNISDLDDASDADALSAEELGVKNPRAFEAISAFTLQYQLQQSFNGEDDKPVTELTGPGGNLIGREAGEGEGLVEGGQVISGTDQEVAQRILDSPNITIASKYLYQIENYAKGNMSCFLDPALLKIIAGIGEVHKIYVNSINRYCTNTCPGGNWAHCRQSHHWSGRAIDISMINNVATNGSKPADIALIKTAAQVTPTDSRLIVGQKQCRPAISYPAGSRVREINDSCDHIHLAVERL